MDSGTEPAEHSPIILMADQLEVFVEEEERSLLAANPDTPVHGDERRYLALVSLQVRALQELFEEIAKQLRERESSGLSGARQTSIVRLTYLRAEAESCEALFDEVKRAFSETSADGDALRQAKTFAMVKTASHVLAKTLSTCSFLLSEEGAVDPALVNRGLIFFAKLSTLFGAAGNPSRQTKQLADFVGLKTVLA